MTYEEYYAEIDQKMTSFVENWEILSILDLDTIFSNWIGTSRLKSTTIAWFSFYR